MKSSHCPSNFYEESCPDDTLCALCGTKYWDGVNISWDKNDPREDGFCSARCRWGLTIDGLDDLASHVCGGPFGKSELRDLEKTIQRRLYRNTDSGICGWALLDDGKPVGFGLSGYCEGSDRELPEHRLLFPFLTKVFDDTVDVCEQESKTEWDRTHGCESCWPEGIMTDDGEWYGPGEPGSPVMPDCNSCNGDGVVL